MMSTENLEARDRQDTLQEVIALLQKLRQYHSQIGDRHIKALQDARSKLAERTT